MTAEILGADSGRLGRSALFPAELTRLRELHITDDLPCHNNYWGRGTRGRRAIFHKLLSSISVLARVVSWHSCPRKTRLVVENARC